MTPCRWIRRRAFTLLELATAVAVIAILAVLAMPAIMGVRDRIERVNCTGNLHTIFVGASSYLQQYHHWPQVNPSLLHAPKHAYEEVWIEAYMPFGVPRASWICPTIQRGLGGPDFSQPDNYRSDYYAMPFDSKPMTPAQWPNQPWFAERGNVHGSGNLVILANGSVVDLFTLDPVAAAAFNGNQP